MILQLHELKYPVPNNIIPGDLSQWACWYMSHMMMGGRSLDGSVPERKSPFILSDFEGK